MTNIGYGWWAWRLWSRCNILDKELRDMRVKAKANAEYLLKKNSRQMLGSMMRMSVTRIVYDWWDGEANRHEKAFWKIKNIRWSCWELGCCDQGWGWKWQGWSVTDGSVRRVIGASSKENLPRSRLSSTWFLSQQHNTKYFFLSNSSGPIIAKALH